MRYIVVTICGTSALTNGASEDLFKLLKRTANDKEKDLTVEKKEVIDRRVEQKRKELYECPSHELRAFTSELNGLLGILGKMEGQKKDLHLQFLLHTDTYQGEKVAGLLLEKCQALGINSQLVLIEFLNTRKFEEFEEGIAFLLEWCHATLPGYRDSGYRVIFNLVGGFKSLQGYMQTLGMLYADESVYVFEGEQELLRIPRLPFDLDAVCQSVMSENLSFFRRLNVLSETVLEEKCDGLPETLFFCMKGECELSKWGKLLWNKYTERAYKEKLLEPPSDKLRFGKKLRAQAKELDPHLLERVNSKIDELTAYLEKKIALKGFSFKHLKGSPVKGCTHEFYLWSDKNAARGFGYFDGGVFVFDQMGSHL